MIDFPSLVVPSFDVFHSDLHSHYNEEAVLAQEEVDYEEKRAELLQDQYLAEGSARFGRLLDGWNTPFRPLSPAANIKPAQRFSCLLNEIRTANSNLIPIGKTTPENDQEEYEPDAEDEEGDNAEEEGEVMEKIDSLVDKCGLFPRSSLNLSVIKNSSYLLNTRLSGKELSTAKGKVRLRMKSM